MILSNNKVLNEFLSNGQVFNPISIQSSSATFKVPVKESHCETAKNHRIINYYKNTILSN